MRNGLILHAVEGALGGALGTFALQQALRQSFRMPRSVQPPELREDPGEFIVARVERLRRRPLPNGAHRRLVGALHWGYGIAWAGLLGALAGKVRIRTMRDAALAGAGMGAVVWAVGYAGWLPATGLSRPVREQGAGHVATALLGHVGYGILSAIPIVLIDRLRARRRPFWSRWLAAL